MPNWTPNKYGATARWHSACVGYETWYCARRSTANRIRKVIAAHDAAGGWCGPATLDALVDYATKPEMRRYPVKTVVEMFAMRGQLRAQAGAL